MRARLLRDRILQGIDCGQKLQDRVLRYRSLRNMTLRVSILRVSILRVIILRVNILRVSILRVSILRVNTLQVNILQVSILRDRNCEFFSMGHKLQDKVLRDRSLRVSISEGRNCGS